MIKVREITLLAIVIIGIVFIGFLGFLFFKSVTNSKKSCEFVCDNLEIIKGNKMIRYKVFDELEELEKRYEYVKNLEITYYPYPISVETNEPIYCPCLFEVVSCMNNDIDVCKIDRIFIPINYTEWKDWFWKG